VSNPTTIQLRRATAAQAAANNPTLAAGELGVETDTGKFKIGDGSSDWSTLTYATAIAKLPAEVQDVVSAHSNGLIDLVGRPVAPTPNGSPGTDGNFSSAADHSHPLGLLGRSLLFGGFPPAYAQDFALDGSWNGKIADPYGWVGPGFAPELTLNASTYTQGGAGNNGSGPMFSSFAGLVGRNIVIDAGITFDSSGLAVMLIASQSITVKGTIHAVGLDASGATGGTGGGANSAFVAFRSQGGANGTSGAGQSSQNAGPNANFGLRQFGGGGGAGGASGSTNGGSAAGPSATYVNLDWSGFFPLGGIPGLIVIGDSGALSAASIAYGGSAGAGDGSAAGGGGGAGGNLILLLAPSITIAPSAVLDVRGGAGAPGTGGNAGGGGGGGGGLIHAHAMDLSISTGATLSTAGGPGGNGAGSGQNGAAGTASPWFQDPSLASGGFGFGAGCVLCQWQ
jgi:hypothetical protein